VQHRSAGRVGNREPGADGSTQPQLRWHTDASAVVLLRRRSASDDDGRVRRRSSAQSAAYDVWAIHGVSSSSSPSLLLPSRCIRSGCDLRLINCILCIDLWMIVGVLI